MTKKIVWLMIFFAVLAVSAQKKRALVIGFSEYQSNIGNLPGAGKDAVELAKTLRLHGNFQVKELIGKNAGKDEVMNEIEKILKDSQEEDFVVLSISGHGKKFKTARGQEVYFPAYDSKMNASTSCIHIDDLMVLIKKHAICKVWITVDVCYAGDAVGRIDIARYNKAVGIFGAAQPGELAEEKYFGRFSSALIQGIQGAADSDQDGKVRLAELVNYTKKTVARRSRTKQNPCYDDFRMDPRLVIGKYDREKIEKELMIYFEGSREKENKRYAEIFGKYRPAGWKISRKWGDEENKRRWRNIKTEYIADQEQEKEKTYDWKYKYVLKGKISNKEKQINMVLALKEVFPEEREMWHWSTPMRLDQESLLWIARNLAKVWQSKDPRILQKDDEAPYFKEVTTTGGIVQGEIIDNIGVSLLLLGEKRIRIPYDTKSYQFSEELGIERGIISGLALDWRGNVGHYQIEVDNRKNIGVEMTIFSVQLLDMNDKKRNKYYPGEKFKVKIIWQVKGITKKSSRELLISGPEIKRYYGSTRKQLNGKYKTICRIEPAKSCFL